MLTTLLLSTLACLDCATSQPVARAPVADVVDDGPATVADARRLLDAHQSGTAQKRLEQLLLNNPTSQSADEARTLLAMAQLQQGDTRSAVPALKSLVDKMPPRERADALLKLAAELWKNGQPAESARFNARALDALSADDARRTTTEDALIGAVDAAPFADVRGLLESECKPGTLLDEVVQFKLARVSVHLRDNTAALKYATAVLARYPAGRFAHDASDLKDKLSLRLNVDDKTVGVLLPLSGEYKSYGKRALAAIKLGFGVQAATDDDKPADGGLDPTTGEPLPVKKKAAEDGVFTGAGGIKLVVKDSAGDPAKASAAITELAQKHHVIAILGDILLDTAVPAALAAEENAVPLISLSRKEGVATAGPWSFRIALTAKKQAKALVDYATGSLGLKRFGIMYPKHAYGTELMNAFWDELDKQHVEVTAIESYAHDQTTFTNEAKALVGRGLGGGGPEMSNCIANAKAITNEFRRKKALNGCSDFAKPSIDFEALFLPDSFRTVSYVVPALVAEDLLLTSDKRAIDAYRKTTGNNGKPVQLLGGSMWNDAELGKRLGKSIDGAVFIDGFDTTDQTPRVSKFVTSFVDVIHSKPTLVEAQAFDAAGLTARILNGASGARTRDQFRDSLQGTKDFPGVTGAIRFDDDGDSITPVHYFQLDDGRIEAKDFDKLPKGDAG
jgi:ABC-type branched-subunit amino acid transport system substrate-binding protein/outer membrane protein assembly factor BamD (BamD/ComL family)